MSEYGKERRRRIDTVYDLDFFKKFFGSHISLYRTALHNAYDTALFADNDSENVAFLRNTYDQFTSQPDYWEQVQNYVGEACSTLKLIFPEVYLEDSDKEQRIKAINGNMRKYLQGEVFDEFQGFILVERTTPDGQVRLGLVLAIDLEDYEYTPQNNAIIKATERTVVERLPARIEVRKGACLESPHIMMLMDDRKDKIIDANLAG